MNLQEMMRQANRMKEKLEKKQKEIGELEVEGSAGGGMIVVKANCNGEILGVKIEQEVVNPEDVEMLQDLVMAAVNQAISRGQEKMNEEMGKIAGGGMGGALPPGMF